MRKIIITAALLAPLALSGAAKAACADDRDCGTVIATGFGQGCAWVRVQSTTFDKVTTYGMSYFPTGPGPTPDMVSTVAQIGRPISIKSGPTIQCQLEAGVPSIVGMSNDPAAQ